jgi:hypothetical protein
MKFLKDTKSFLVNVANDQRIPDRDKKIILGMVALIISPIDLIPDWIPIIGVMDDFILLCIVMDYFFTVLDQNIILSHYPWDMKSFSKIRRGARFMSMFVPTYFKKLIWKYTKGPY